MAGPTNPQHVAAVYDYLVSYIAAHQRPPTRQQIATATGCGSPSTAHRHLIRLRRQGLVQWHRHRSLSLHLVCPQVQSSESEPHHVPPR